MSRTQPEPIVVPYIRPGVDHRGPQWEDDRSHCMKCGAETVRERLKVSHYRASNGMPEMLSLRTCPNRRWPLDGHMREWTHAWPAGGEPDPRRLSL